MANIFDVAKYILEKLGTTSAMKLQKLAYYSQVWHIVWEEEELFSEDFEAWANGPVIRSLYSQHRGLFKVDADTFTTGSSDNLTETEKENIDIVLQNYGEKTAQWLSNLTHKEDPWKIARDGYEPMQSCEVVITKASLLEYYSAL